MSVAKEKTTTKFKLKRRFYKESRKKRYKK